ncbi:TatD family hydrolase, partial [uncultured Muribaculum sp.]
AEDVERIREIGDFYFGINGIVTFKNSKLRDVLPVIGLDRTVLETDAPYLAPVPHRGKRNESAFIIHTAAHVASALQLSIEEVSDVTSNNAKTIFNLDI